MPHPQPQPDEAKRRAAPRLVRVMNAPYVPPVETNQRRGEFPMRTVHCVKLEKDAPGLDKPPFAGELGKRIFESVSAEAWDMWLEHQKMLMNEYRIDLSDKSSRQILKQQMEQFFWGDGSKPPPDFVPEKK